MKKQIEEEMTKKKTYHVMLIIMSSLNLFAGPFDSGLIEWNQPNGVTFVARHWGDEFQWWMRTDNGYSIIKGNDGWYYYTQLVDEFQDPGYKIVKWNGTDQYNLEVPSGVYIYNIKTNKFSDIKKLVLIK